MDEPILARLEAAEMRARERRLEASSEAERRIEAARVAAAEIEAGADEVIRHAVDELRERYRRQAAIEVAAIEEDLGRLEDGRDAATGSAGATADRADGRFDAAVAVVVRTVLGEAGG